MSNGAQMKLARNGFIIILLALMALMVLRRVSQSNASRNQVHQIWLGKQGSNVPLYLQLKSHMCPNKVCITYFSLDLESFHECGGTYTNSSGTITSPSYPNIYPHNAECDYFISQPNGTCINISINHFEINDVVGICSSDYLEIEGGINTASSTIGKYCGKHIARDIPASVHSNQNYIRLR